MAGRKTLARALSEALSGLVVTHAGMLFSVGSSLSNLTQDKRLCYKIILFMRVFLSWSGPRSRAVANALREWLPDVLQSVVPFMSAEDIPKGAQWASKLGTELSEAAFAIICVTSENRDKPWLNFEAGALSNALSNPLVCPLLLDIKSTDIDGPLSTFQMAEATADDMKRLVATMNAALPVPLSSTQLQRAFDRSWNDLEAQIKAVRDVTVHDEVSMHRPVEELAQETLDVVREQARTLAKLLEAVRHQSTVESAVESIGAIPPALRSLKPGDVVKHTRWGQGTVTSRPGSPNDGLVTIHFSRVGPKMLMLKYAPIELIATKEEVDEVKREHAEADLDSEARDEEEELD